MGHKVGLIIIEDEVDREKMGVINPEKQVRIGMIEVPMADGSKAVVKVGGNMSAINAEFNNTSTIYDIRIRDDGGGDKLLLLNSERNEGEHMLVKLEDVMGWKVVAV